MSRHDHYHGHHHHNVGIENVNNAFIIGIVLNFLFVVIEVAVGLNIHSLSLLSDAGHNLADVTSLALSLFAIKMLAVKTTEKYTYRYKKTKNLVSLFNAMVLLISLSIIGYLTVNSIL